MPIVRKLWTEHITKTHVPSWPCPGCMNASLNLIKGSFVTIEDRNTYENNDHPEWEHEFSKGRFVCLLQCNNYKCQESCAVSGNYGVAVDEYERTYEEHGRPTSIVPAPRMISVPESCPNNVLSELNAAFGLFWIDYSASLNRIRIALEMILTDLGIKRSSVPRSGTIANAAPSAKKRVRLNLHQRIELLKNKKPQLTNIFERMMAVKHLGNAGSHSGTAVVIDDVFDGLDILEKILQDLYSEDPKILIKTVMQINKHKGPRKKPQN